MGSTTTVQAGRAVPGQDTSAPLALLAAAYVRANVLKLLAVSAAVLIPCFWHTRIQAGDLGSHLYNAWLASLVEKGQAPGLWIARQSSNVLFDIVLLRLGTLLGWPAAEKIAVSAAVLIFFWGAFALVTTTARRRPWELVPLIAMLAYGWTFNMGFFNFYISLGLSFFVLALAWRCRTRIDALLAVILLPVIWLAHPLGLAWAIPAVAYVSVARRIPRISHLGLLLAAVVVIFGLREFLSLRYRVLFWRAPFYATNGSDQFILYGMPYVLLAFALLVTVLGFLLLDTIQRWQEKKGRFPPGIPAQLYIVAFLALILLPDAVWLPLYPAPMTMIMERFSVVTVVFGYCVLAGMQPRKLHTAGFAAIALVFFALYYADTGRVGDMERQANALVSKLPPRQRVIATIHPLRGARLYLQHIVDRACIGRCFSYANYEPDSTQFRLRASPGNGIVAADIADSDKMQVGQYVVRPGDLPVYQIYQCSATGTDLCIRPLTAGEMNGAPNAAKP